MERVCLYITIFLQGKGANLEVGIQEKMEKEKTIIIYIGESEDRILKLIDRLFA